MNVESILRAKGANVETVRPDCTVREAAQKLTRARIGALVVSADGRRIAGILSERDIIRQIAGAGESALAKRVDAVMMGEVITCALGDTVNQLMAVMTERRVRHLPVVDEGLLVGIVSIGDVVKRRIEETEHEAEALRQYITAG